MDVVRNISFLFDKHHHCFGQLAKEKPATSEVTTFTVFFMAFTAVMGKDLVSVDNDSLDKLDSISILSTYEGPGKHKRQESQHIADLVDEIVMMGVDDDLPEHPTKETKRQSTQKYNTPPRNRFNNKLSTLKIMEARETAKAELGIAFEMLKMMKERGLRADPEAYECLIDACGRCGDTDRATQLLSRMHEDGIVADGVVYSSLVAAFSSENAWKRVSGEFQEELPGQSIIFSLNIRFLYTDRLTSASLFQNGQMEHLWIWTGILLKFQNDPIWIS